LKILASFQLIFFLNQLFFCQHINQSLGGGGFFGDGDIRAQFMQLFRGQMIATTDQDSAGGII